MHRDALADPLNLEMMSYAVASNIHQASCSRLRRLQQLPLKFFVQIRIEIDNVCASKLNNYFVHPSGKNTAGAHGQGCH